MVTRDLSGDDVAKVLDNAGPFYVDRVQGDHIILEWDPPADHDSDPRTVPRIENTLTRDGQRARLDLPRVLRFSLIRALPPPKRKVHGRRFGESDRAMKVSVVVPTYSMERYDVFTECVESACS